MLEELFEAIFPPKTTLYQNILVQTTALFSAVPHKQTKECTEEGSVVFVTTICGELVRMSLVVTCYQKLSKSGGWGSVLSHPR